MKKARQSAWAIKDEHGRLLLNTLAPTQVKSAEKAHRAGKDWRQMLQLGCCCVKVEIREL